MLKKMKRYILNFFGRHSLPSNIISSGLPAKKYTNLAASSFSQKRSKSFFKRIQERIQAWFR